MSSVTDQIYLDGAIAAGKTYMARINLEGCI